MSEGAPVADLLPPEAYREELAAMPLARTGLVAGIAFALLFGVGFPLLARLAGLPGADAPGAGRFFLLAALLSGALFGLSFPVLLRHRLRATLERMVAGSGAFAIPRPEGRWTWRVRGNLRRGWREVGGALFAAPGVATFVPHAANLPGDRRPIEIVRGGGATVRLARPHAALVARLDRFLARPVVEIATPARVWRLRVPRAATVAAALDALLGAGAPREP